MAKAVKTNAMRILERLKIDYQSFQYQVSDDHLDGTMVARMNQRDVSLVHKTLVTKANAHDLFVFIIPIDRTLDLKKAAKAAGQKKIEMLPHNDLLKYTGYVKGGCSPIGMKKLYPSYLSEMSEAMGSVIVSGGKKGHIIELSVGNLQRAANVQLADLCVV